MGPLSGFKVIEMAGIGPIPHAAMLLADMGADVVRVDRKHTSEPSHPPDVTFRGRPTIGVDLKHPSGAKVVLELVERADALIEGFRPGVMERLGLGPHECWHHNARLVYGRMTGWGQHGPLARTAGHDINYIALSGVLHNLCREGERPVPPLNLVGDYGGGSMFLIAGLLAALLHAERSGEGQIVDAAIVDGSASLMMLQWAWRGIGKWNVERPGTNIIDTGAPFYDVYECADGRYVAVGAIEPQFYSELLKGMGLDQTELPHQMDQDQWPAMKHTFATVFTTRTRDEWWHLFEGTDACLSPVLSPGEVEANTHMRTRGTIVKAWGVEQPAPAPRFSKTQGGLDTRPQDTIDTEGVLAMWGLDTKEIRRLKRLGVL